MNKFQHYRFARDRMDAANVGTVKLQLLAARSSDGREYDLPTVDELAQLIVDETGGASYQPDIVVEHQSSELQRISPYHPSIMALQYPLLFPYGEDGWHANISVQQPTYTLKTVSQCDFYAYRLQIRFQESSHLLLSRRLFQQYVVNAYAFVEAERLYWIKNNQVKLRYHYFQGLADAFTRGDTNLENTGKHVILATSHTGSPRYQGNLFFVDGFGGTGKTFLWQGDDIWAEIPVSLLDRFTHLMVEQKSYTIHQLNVIAAPEEYRPTSNKFVIQFHALTTVEEIPDIPSIPYYKFTFITETELRAGCETENPTVLLDVIGHVIDYSRTQNCQEELCLWNRFVAMMDEVLAANGDKPLVLIATSVYIRLRNGNPVLYTSSATQLCGNLQIPEVLHFFNWYASEVTAPVLINPSDITKTPVVTIEETNALIKESNNQESGEAKE
ncbi:hypothetical protein LINPERHAP1_LOCUS31340 [Linum perenne]